MEVADIVSFLNENPRRFLNGRAKVNIQSQPATTFVDHIEGGLVVLCANETFRFLWERDKNIWIINEKWELEKLQKAQKPKLLEKVS